MFEILSDKLNQVFHLLGNKGRLTEKDIDEALRQVRLALLEADVNFKVVKDFVTRVRDRALGANVRQSLTPAQQIVKIVNEELVVVLGGEPGRLTAASQPPSVVMLTGLQGSGKTTTAAKLARHLKQTGQRLLLVAADNRRPAAIEQLVTLGKQLDVPVYRESPDMPGRDVCARARVKAKEMAATWVIVDTAGRLHIDEAMMDELVQMKKELKPDEMLLVVDAMTGQDAVRMAGEFHSRVSLTGLILTKMDGDARGGAALSIRWVSGVPIKFIGTGEKADAFEPFYPDRLASRILGMGDVLAFIEKAEAIFDQQQASELEKKVRAATFDLTDFLAQLRSIKKMGPVAQLVELLPGMSKLAGQLPVGIAEKQMKTIEAIILSMTPEERHNPNIIGGGRRRRIARGSGLKPQDINQLLHQFQRMLKMLKMLKMGSRHRHLLPRGNLPRDVPGIFG